MNEKDYYLDGYRDGIVAGKVNRAAIIEECARDVLDEMINECILTDEQRAVLEQAAVAIRALKDKPQDKD